MTPIALEICRAVELRGNDIVTSLKGGYWRVKSSTVGSGQTINFEFEAKGRRRFQSLNCHSTVTRFANPVDIDRWLEEENLR